VRVHTEFLGKFPGKCRRGLVQELIRKLGPKHQQELPPSLGDKLPHKLAPKLAA
jgi:hypothetical protein